MKAPALTIQLGLGVVLMAAGGGLGTGAGRGPAVTPPTPTAAVRHTAGRILYFEGFEDPFHATVAEGNAVVPYGGYPSSGSGAYWGRAVARAAFGVFSAWCAAAGPAAPGGLYAAGCAGPYGWSCWVPPLSNSTMTFGPLDLSQYESGALAFDYWLDTEFADPFSVQASVDGVNFHGYTYYGVSSGYQHLSLSLAAWPVLGDLTGHPEVSFRFGYSSDGSSVWRGAWVDNVRVEGVAVGQLFADGFETGDTSGWSSSHP